MEGPSRYLIGIDLGTTNSAVAFVDTRESANEADSSGIRVFEVAQLTSPGEVRAVPLLPSFLYFPTEDEVSSGTVSLPWEEHPSSIVGMMARDQGALVPGRQVSSAKSWLCQSAIDRTANILPREAEPPEPMVSPVEASARYLMHLRNAWNHAMTAEVATNPQQLFENQEIVLTVPASFDEEARELTVEAAREAGLAKPDSAGRAAGCLLRVGGGASERSRRAPARRRARADLRHRRRHLGLQPRASPRPRPKRRI